MKQYVVTGMSCAACSARVEKAVSKVEGVTSCSVSLLTNSMGVEGTAQPEDIIAAVEAAGYGASVKDGSGQKKDSAAGSAEERYAGRSGNARSEKTPDSLPGFFDCAYVRFHGPYDVGLASSGGSR